jgi:nucleoid DNA-binding protein
MLKTGTLTKAHIVQAIVDGNGYTAKKASEIVEIIIELIKQSL